MRMLCPTLLLISAVFVHSAAASTPESPLLISDFERTSEVGAWTGLAVKRTDNHASSGKWGMRFTFPKWQEGRPEWPLVALAYDGGKGYVTGDWSAHGEFAWDAWVEGDTARTITLELRDTKGKNGATAGFLIEPGKANHCRMPLEQAGREIDLKHVEEIVFFAARPTESFTITIDNLLLTPSGPPPAARFELVYPNYRGLVMPGAGDVEVSCEIVDEPLRADDLHCELTIAGPQGGQGVSHPLRQRRQTFTFPAARLSAGPFTLAARLLRAQGSIPLAGKAWECRRLTPEELSRLSVYIDRNNNTIVDGKPFFPLGFYGSTSDQHLEELADSPFNCLLNYGTNHEPKARMLAYLDKLQARGLKLIYCMNDVYPTATYLEKLGWEGIKGNDAIAEAVIKAYRDHPAILAWYLNDELPRSLVPRLEEYYERVKALDPGRPCYTVLCEMAEVRYFAGTTDVMGVDPYPVPKSPLTVVSDWMDASNAAVGARKPTWLVPQAFAWYQYKPQGSNRARKPTDAELKTGRAPTYDEERCMTYLALAHGARGLIYYCYYDLRVLPQYAEMWAGLKKIAAEVKHLSPVLLAPDEPGKLAILPADAPVHTRLKRHDGSLYLIAVNPADKPCTVTFQLKHAAERAEVLFEQRDLVIADGRLEDTFPALGVHVYKMK